MARPAKLTDETVEIIIDAIKVGCPIGVVCQAAGIGRTTFKSWMARGKSADDADAPFRAFRAAVRKARAHGEAHALKIIRDAMPDHWQAAAWFLERSRPRRWGRVDRLKATLVARGAGGKDIDFSRLSDAELQGIVDGTAAVAVSG